MIHRISFFSMFLFLLTACGPTAEDLEQLQQDLADAGMVVHDAIMPKTAEVNRLSRELTSFYEASKDSLSEELDGKVEMIQRALDQADDGMMAWMANYQPPSTLREEKSHEEIMDFLNQQKAEIDKVSEQIEACISEAKAFLDTHAASEE